MLLQPEQPEGLNDLPEPIRERIRAILPYWIKQGSVQGRWGRDGKYYQYLRVWVTDADGRRSHVSIGLGCDDQLIERVMKALAEYGLQHWPELPARLQREMKRQAQRAARNTLQQLAPSRAAFRRAWQQIQKQELPADPVRASAYARLVAQQLPVVLTGRPRKNLFPRPAALFQVPKPGDLDERDYLLATMIAPNQRKPSRWNPRRPLKAEDLFWPDGVAGLAALKPEDQVYPA